MKSLKKYPPAILILISLLFLHYSSHAQMRQVYLENTPDNKIYKLSFYSPSEGYVAFRNWIGYTTDSGRTFTKKRITINNVDFNGYPVNLTFGFSIKGVKAFNQNTIIAYGDYGFVPAILYSTNGGNTFKLIYHSQFAFVPSGGITDMIFPQNDNVGYAIDVDQILKTIDQGLTWFEVRTDPNSCFDHLEAVDNNNIFAISDYYVGDIISTNNSAFVNNKILKTNNAGTNWQTVSVPGGWIRTASFITANNGWVNADKGIFYTADAGGSWIQKNNSAITPFLSSDKMKFINDSTGYTLTGGFDVNKTTDSGKVWESLPRDNKFTYAGFGYNDLQFLTTNQLWAGGGRGFLELSTNGGGTPLPGAYFSIDTTGVPVTGNVNLINYSKKGYAYKWYVNNVQISTSYNTTYTHSISRQNDSIKLVVISGGLTNTLEKIQYFIVPDLPAISSFLPATGSTGTFITINGTGFKNVTAVKFGGVSAASFTIISDTKITATVANGSTGAVTVTDIQGTFALAGFTYYAPSIFPPPSITSISPLYGPVGTAVTITGNNFNSKTVDNLVFFGATKASLISSSSTQIICTVPLGASFKPISVLNKLSNLSGESLKPFNVTFADSTNFTLHSFVSAYTFYYPEINYPKFIMGKDIDGDGKPDMIGVVGGYYDSVAVYRNTTTSGQFSFEPRINIGVMQPLGIGMFDVDDLDGDGKPDVAVPSNNESSLIIIKNNSTPGIISFAEQVNLPIQAGGPQDLVIADLDNDGKKDIAVAEFDVSFMSIIRNTSVPGFLSFAEKKHFLSGGYPLKLAVGDIDGDGKKDIVVYNYFYASSESTFSLFQNISTPGNILFAPKVDFNVPGRNQNGKVIELVDYDNDSKLDVIVMNENNYCIFRNTSTLGNISFDPIISAALGLALEISQGGHLSNLSGDDKPDIFTGNSMSWSGNAWLYQNNSIPGIIKTDNAVDFGAAPGAYYSNSADFNLDGKIDVVMSFPGLAKICKIYKNNIGIPIIFSICLGGNTSLSSDISGTTYQWQQDKGSGFVNLTNNANISGAQSNKITFTSIPLSWNGYKYRCVADGYYSSPFVMQINGVLFPSVSISTPVTTICIGTPVTFAATGINGGVSPFYRWLVNGIEVGTNSSTYTTRTLNNNDKIRVVLFSSDICLNFPRDTSNIITVTVTGGTPSVTITSPVNSACAGTPITFTTTLVNGGTLLSYQWQVNGVNAGTNSPVFTTSSLANGSQVKVFITMNTSCSTTIAATSNTITVTINSKVPPVINISTTASNICTGAIVTFTATPSNGGNTPIYQWQVDNINMGINSPEFTTSLLINGSQVKVIMTSSASCVSQPTATSNTITMTVSNPVMPSVSVSASSTNTCIGTSVTFTAIPINGGASPLYQWKKNGANTGINSTTYSSNTLVNGDVITVALTSNAICTSSATVNSNNITMSVNDSVTAIISIDGNTTVTQGTSTTISSAITNGGSSPGYQWQDSTDTHSWLNISGVAGSTINYMPALTGDKIKCILSSNAPCATGITATSNALQFYVNTVNPTTENNYGIRYFPNPVSSTLIIDSLKISDQWETVDIRSINGLQNIISQNINGQTRITINVEGLSSGIYFAIIRRKDGESVYLKFIKL
jgi:photosystem II stability/assembly factor-like uncharacterized protein